MNKTIAFALFLIMTFSSGVLLARPGNKDEGYREGRRNGQRHHKKMFFGNTEKMKKKLELTDSQVNKIEKINIKFKRKFLKNKEAIAPKRIRLKRLLLEDEINLKKVRSLLREMSDVKINLRMSRIRHRIAIEKVLTPEQKRKHRKQKRRKGRKHRRHGR